MERQGKGMVSAYILNLMVHSDTLQLDEQEIRDKLEKRFKQRKITHIRPQNVRKFHIEPLIKKHWLREVDGKYERVGELRHVSPAMTLRDQFEGIPEEYVESYIHDKEFNRKLYGSEDFEGTLTEKEFKEYIEKKYRNSIS